MGYLTIGVIFATALSGGQQSKTPTTCPLPTFVKSSEQNCRLLSFRD
jgi:hypothetical protein